MPGYRFSTQHTEKWFPAEFSIWIFHWHVERNSLIAELAKLETEHGGVRRRSDPRTEDAPVDTDAPGGSDRPAPVSSGRREKGDHGIAMGGRRRLHSRA
jgi:hypothetical protein